LSVTWLFSILFFLTDAWSCSVPVFRYALERWRPDAYEGIIIYRKAMTEEEQELLQRLRKAALNPEVPLNLRIREVNTVSFSEKKLKELLRNQVPEKLPALTVWYPGHLGKTAPLWTVALIPSVVEGVTQSPKRDELAKRLIAGDAAVWLFVPSGNPAKDNNARALINQELESAVSSLCKIPTAVIPGYKEENSTPGFSVLPLYRTDPEERFLLDMLLHSESDLGEHKDEPMVFPVFGRGRLLGCLFGEYITQKNIREAAAFLTGNCSCEIKALNPGVDLLMAARWNRAGTGSYVSETPLPPLTGVMPGPLDSEEKKSPNAGGRTKRISVLTSSIIALGSVMVVVVLVSLILINRRRR
jgi:hypothetical protein